MIKKFYGNLGFLNKFPVNIPRNVFVPNCLYENFVSSENLSILGNNRNKIIGGAISTSKNLSMIAAIGEYIERYSSSFQNSTELIKSSYKALNDELDCFDPINIKYFNKKQYDSDFFRLNKLSIDSTTYWKESINYFTGNSIFLPFFMTNVENIEDDGLYHINTTTGTATHKTLDLAIQGGLLECIERDAFSKFWYYQNLKKFKKFSKDNILQIFKNDEIIFNLFNNKKVKIIVYDLGEYSFCPTYAVFIYFKKKGKIYYSLGASSRLEQNEALKKACIEAYQGIEFTELSCEKLKNEFDLSDIQNGNFSNVISFDKHYVLYNLFPELKEHVPIFIENENNSYKENWIFEYSHHIRSFDKKVLLDKGIY